jgi:hypothetical protein
MGLKMRRLNGSTTAARGREVDEEAGYGYHIVAHRGQFPFQPNTGFSSIIS